LSRIAGAARADGTQPVATDWLRALGPWVAPLALAVCGARVDALAPVALTWMVLLVPGFLAVNHWFPAGHPLGAGVSRLGVASLLALVPFGMLAYAGCMLHLRLTTALALYGVAYIAMTLVLGRALARREPTIQHVRPAEPFDLPATAPRWTAVVVLLAIAAMLVGVCMSAPKTHVPDAEFMDRAARPGWWHGAVIGGVAAVVAAGVLAVALLRSNSMPTAAFVKGDARGDTRVRGRGKRGRERTAPPTVDWERWAVVPLWVACAVLTFHLMRATYSVSIPKMEWLAQGMHAWDVDDVAYISEAVDYRYGHEMGRYDPSVGGAYALPRVRMSPLFAPLVAAISLVTGVECAALHHSVMPPLVVLVGVSCYAALLMVIFRGHRWLVPLGVLIVLLLVYKTWDYARCAVEMLMYRAMQGKGLHLWWPLPVQISSLVLLARYPSLKHWGLCCAIALVGHLTHPLATIMGMVLCTTVALVAVAERRGAFLKVLLVLIVYCGLAGEFRLAAQINRDLPDVVSDRVPGEPLESADLVRVDAHRFRLGREFESDLKSGTVTPALAKAFDHHDISLPRWPIGWDEAGGYYFVGANRRGGYRVRSRDDYFDVYQIQAEPRIRHDPFWTFGCNTLYLTGSLAVPLVLALGLRRRELLYVGALGAAVLISTNFEPLGRVLNVALPTSIFWRARWMLPALVNAAVVGVVIWWALSVLVRSRDGRVGAGRTLLASFVAAGAFGLMIANTDSRAVKVGESPQRLTKFSPDTHELVEKLGGVEASPFVWGAFYVHHELPQLMPNVQLVFSRTKFMRPADDPNFRGVAMAAFNGYREGVVNPAVYDRLLANYPIDHVVVDRVYQQGAQLLAEYLEARGWRLIGRTSRRYEVWRSPAWTSPTTPES
jgi:hypothetical protein